MSDRKKVWLLTLVAEVEAEDFVAARNVEQRVFAAAGRVSKSTDGVRWLRSTLLPDETPTGHREAPG
jgi:hypothetical protein